MEIDIGGEKFDVEPAILEGMLDAMGKTAKDGNEHGFLMCDTSMGIAPGKTCTGNNCSINLEDCGGLPTVGGFHSHPTVASFSMSDYLIGIKRAAENPGHKHLLCVSLLDKRVRCKALKKLPPKGKKFPFYDSEETRAMVKPYYTKRINISVEQINELLKGTPWVDLPVAEPIIAEDEGEGVEAGGKVISQSPKTYELLVEELQAVYEKMTAPKFKSELVEGKLMMVPIPQAEILSSAPEWIKASDIESPDPNLIAGGEVLGYAKGMTPVQLLDEKVDGKWKIHDGRHRLTAFVTAGYKTVPVVFVKP